ncbi:MAG: hypothetical protein EOP06_15155 [Proteobacteria bacterium]|nr:MAG: hypothetical protein EOP06_15155 [Pseudomonadota bacterium]
MLLKSVSLAGLNEASKPEIRHAWFCFGQHGLVVLGHEAVHFRVCKTKLLNDIIGNLLCFMPIGLTLSCYRAFHLPHHRNPFGAEDPELPLRRALGKSFAPPFDLARGLKLWGVSYLGFSFKELVIFSSMLPKSSVIDRIFTTALWITALVVFYPTSLNVLALWFYALGTTYISKVRIQGWYEHGLPAMDTNRYKLSSPLLRLIFPHNIWVHYEHHKYPSIPFYNLTKVRALEVSPRIYSINEMAESLDSQRLEGGDLKRAA